MQQKLEKQILSLSSNSKNQKKKKSFAVHVERNVCMQLHELFLQNVDRLVNDLHFQVALVAVMLVHKNAVNNVYALASYIL